MPQTIAVIGECMLELSRQSSEPQDSAQSMRLSYGGDTLNSAIYLARQGIEVDYVTSLGDDPMSSWMVEQWSKEGVGCSLIDYQSDAVPGMYLIETDDSGERSFYYWRDSSPARRLFDDAGRANGLFEQFSNFGYLFLSGITLAIYSDSSRQRLFSLLSQYRDKGGKVIFDGNYRPKLWESREITKQAYESMYRLTDIALPTIDDEQALFGDADSDSVVKRLQSWGVQEIVLKMGEKGCLVTTAESSETVPAKRVTPVDTTSAGDSFNAGYMAARFKGKSAADAALSGHGLASVVIQHKGAIIPAGAMPNNI